MCIPLLSNTLSNPKQCLFCMLQSLPTSIVKGNLFTGYDSYHSGQIKKCEKYDRTYDMCKLYENIMICGGSCKSDKHHDFDMYFI